MRIAIAGAGIAGLTSAIALAARGFEVDAFRARTGDSRRSAPASSFRRTRWRCSSGSASCDELGGRLSSPRRSRFATRRSGAALAKIAARRSCASNATALPTARSIAPTCRRRFLRQRDDQPSIVFHLGAEVRDVSSNETGVHALSPVAKPGSADILVAADGVHSIDPDRAVFGIRVRRSLGRSAWRAIVPARR